MKRVRVVLAAPAAADVEARRDSRDYLHLPLERSVGAVAPGPAPGPGAVAVAIDVLRATTSLSVAFSNGAARVLPAGTVAEGFRLRDQHPGALLCGEREGKKVPGFDLGNSPFEYSREVVAGRTLLFASTNGSQALRHAVGADRRLLAAFVNVTATAERLANAEEVWLVAAGKLGRFALEDAACAGWLMRSLRARGFDAAGPAARIAEALAPPDAAAVRALLEGCSHGRYLRSLGAGFARDVEFCARVDAIGSAFEV